MKTLMAVIGVAALVLPAQAADTGAAHEKISRQAQQFLSDAASANAAEQELGRLAAARAENARVKDFGRRMVQDHNMAQDRLQDLAKDHGLDVSSKIKPEDRATIERLAKLHGAEFDRAYMKAMREDHTKDVQKFEQATKSLPKGPVQQYAVEITPVLREHLHVAREVSDSLTKATSGAGRSHQH
jgi:putative membrane protein